MDRAHRIDDVVTEAIEAIEAGYPHKADELLRHAAHHDITPSELVIAISRRSAVAHDVPPPEEETSMLVTYVGPEPGVRLAPELGDVWCARGEPVEVPDHVGHALCAQDTFKPARRRRPPAAARPETAGETPESTDPTMETRHGTQST